MKIVLGAGAYKPTRGTKQAAGLDLYSPEEIWIKPGGSTFVNTRVAVQLQPDEYAEIKGRSGLARRGIMVATGTIDADYRGELGIILFNVTDEVHHVRAGDRIAQLVVMEVRRPDVEIVDALDETERGAGGFGSTGR